MISWKNSCLQFLRLDTNQQILNRKSLASRIKPVTRSSLNLPSLVILPKLNYCDTKDDINQVFLKLSALYSNLHDPLKELLFQCACEGQQIPYKVSYFDKISRNLVPKEACYSPQPAHIPLKTRNISNKTIHERTSFGVYKPDVPLATIIARWIRMSMSSRYDSQLVIQELANFGDIQSVIPFGRQAVVITFKELRSACKAISAFPPNGRKRHIKCFWYHKFMLKYQNSKR